MAFWGKSTWERRAIDEKIVVPWIPGRLDEAGYRLSVGDEIFTNDKEDHTARKLAYDESFIVGPGQFLYVLTEERVAIPRDCIAFISARATTKFRGLVNVSGFQVDPGYSGKLIFAMFNAGPMNIHLKRGDDIFSIWISNLAETIPEDFKGTNQIPDGLSHIPTKIINSISGKALTAYQVNDALSKIKEDLSKAQQDVTYIKISTGIIIALVFLFVAPSLRDGFVSWVNEVKVGWSSPETTRPE